MEQILALAGAIVKVFVPLVVFVPYAAEIVVVAGVVGLYVNELGLADITKAL
jgi:uncharacterized membrane protein (DUF106 family)